MVASIEFIGIPGSGKSTLYNAVLNELKNQNKPIIDYNNPYSAYFPSLTTRFVPDQVKRYLSNRYLQYRVDSIDILSSVFSHNTELLPLISSCTEEIASSEQSQQLLLSWVFETFVRYNSILTAKKEEFLIIDEGPVQRSMSLFVSPDEYIQEYVNKYIQNIRCPEMVFITDVSLDVAIQRLDNREASRPTRLIGENTETVRSFLTYAQELISDLEAVLQQADVKTHRINTNAPVEHSKNECLRIIDQEIYL